MDLKEHRRKVLRKFNGDRMSYLNKFRFLCLGLLFGLYVICPVQAETLKTSVHRTEKVRQSLGSGLNDEGSKILRNSFSVALAATSGGVGGRWNYHRKLNSVFATRLGFEFIAYSASHVSKKLKVANNPYIESVTVLSFPFGFQGSLGFLSSFVPHLEVGIGPYIRLDHQEQIAPDRGQSFTNDIVSDVNLLLDLVFPQRLPKISFAFGAFVGGGFDILVGENLDAAITVNGYHHYIRFSENLFQPGDFSGFVVSVGFMKYF